MTVGGNWQLAIGDLAGRSKPSPLPGGGRALAGVSLRSQTGRRDDSWGQLAIGDWRFGRGAAQTGQTGKPGLTDPPEVCEHRDGYGPHGRSRHL